MRGDGAIGPAKEFTIRWRSLPGRCPPEAHLRRGPDAAPLPVV